MNQAFYVKFYIFSNTCNIYVPQLSMRLIIILVKIIDKKRTLQQIFHLPFLLLIIVNNWVLIVC